MKAVVEDKKGEYVVDSKLRCYPIDEINSAFSIALMCLETEPSNGPTMAKVVKMLEQIKSEEVVTDS